MPEKHPALLIAKVGDITMVSLGDGTYCYLRKYQFCYGVLPFLSHGVQLDVASLPSLTPAFFIHIWVHNNDPTPMRHVANIPFATDEESWGPPAYHPPDNIENCYRIHGIFNGLFCIIKPVTEADVAGLEVLKRYQPAELRDFLHSRQPEWEHIPGSDLLSEPQPAATEAPPLPVFLEIVFQAADFTFDGRDEVEDPLETALSAQGLGEVTGGGTGLGMCNIDVEVTDIARGLALIRQVLRELGVARSTRIYQNHPEPLEYAVYD